MRLTPDLATASDGTHMAESPVVTAIVVSHDSGEYLADCVADLLAQTLPIQIVVVDNASQDGSLDKLPESVARELIRNSRNVGFGVACNQGAAKARASRLLFVNPDCRLPAGSVARLCHHLDSNPKLGILGANLLNPDGTAQSAARRRTPLPLRAIREALGLSTEASCPSEGNGTPLLDVEATSGALMVMRREVFERLQGFDPGYVLHCEDLDLCRRVLDAGYRIAVATDVSITHVKGTSSHRRPIWVEWQKHRGMWRYFQKFDAANSPLWLRLLVPLGIAAHFPIAAVRAWRRKGLARRRRPV